MRKLGQRENKNRILFFEQKTAESKVNLVCESCTLLLVSDKDNLCVVIGLKFLFAIMFLFNCKVQ